MKLLTLVVPAYNMQEYVSHNIEQVLAASCRNDIDLLIVNDGSTDSTKKIVESYVTRFPSIVRCITKNNGHYGSAVNWGIDNAQGRFLKIVDSDDWVNPKGLDTLVAFLSSHSDVDLVLTDYVKVFEDNSLLVKGVDDAPENTVFEFTNHRLTPFLMHAMTVQTKLLREHHIRLDEGVLFTDEEFSVYPLPYVKTVAYLPTVVYEYRLDRSGQSVDLARIDKNMSDNYFVVSQIIDWHAKLDRSALTQTELEYYDAKIAYITIHHIRLRMLSRKNTENKTAVKKFASVLSAQVPLFNGYIPKSIKMLQRTNCFGYGLVATIFRFLMRSTTSL